MADDVAIGTAMNNLDQLLQVLKNTIKIKFDNDSAMWIIKAWTKIGIALRGKDYHRFLQMYLQRRTPTPRLTGALKRSQVLLKELGSLSDAVGRHNRVPNDQVWNIAHLAMLHFIQDYWQATVSQTDPKASEKNFSNQLRLWANKTADQVMAEKVFGGE